jgi:polysaccharide pyruvyl transferase WcaK-like protein
VTPSYKPTIQGLKQWIVDVGIVMNDFRTVRFPLAMRRGARRVQPSEGHAFLILPGDPDAPTGSIGDMAMFTGLMQALRKMHPEATFTLVGTHAHQVCIPQIGMVEVVAAWTGSDGAMAFDALVRKHRALFVLGADIMDGMYGAALVCRLLAYCNHAVQIGIPSTVLGFSFSQTPRAPAVHAFKHVHPKVRLNIRDGRSLTRFVAATGTRAHLAADVAFLMAPADRTVGEVEAWIEKMRDTGRTLVGVNLSTHALDKVIKRMGNEGLVAAVAEQLLGIGKRENLAYLLIPHDVKPRSGDILLLGKLESVLLQAGFAQVRYTAQDDPARIKALVGQLDLVLTSRMHLAIACLGVGTPTLCVSYLDKFEGLYEHFGLSTDDLLPGVDIEISELGRHLSQSLQRRLAARQQIANKTPAVLALSRLNVDDRAG